ncbi:tetratricopeptide repeat protein [Chondromyces crocatus]|nr:tetratricopeptide repeat protein [Chondromyces crocatus]
MKKQSKKGVLRTLRALAGAATVATCAIASTPASAADTCVTQAAKDALASCPGGKLQVTMGKKPQVSFKSAPQGVNLKKRDDLTKPTNPSASQSSAQRDERRSRLAPKVRSLLVTEIQGLEGLFSSTPKNAPDRPKLMRRLAEGYVELESAAFRDKTENSIKADEAKRKNPKAATGFKTESDKADKILVAARQAAIKYYTLLKSQYPKWCQSSNAADPAKSTGCTDEVLYYLAYEYEQAQQLDQARKVYFELIQNWPQSKFIPNAYLAFGELFFNEAQGDPSKWALAEKSYLEVTKYPAPDNKVWGYAHYKLGYVYWNQGDFPRSISEFKKTIEYGQQYSQLPNAAQLAIAARRDIIPVYALAGDPKRSFDFLRPLSGDSGGGTDKTFKMMDDLGQNYLDTGHYREGIELYQDLMKRDKGPKYCVYQGHITEATLAMKSGNKDNIMAELNRQLEVYQQFEKEGHPADNKLKCANITAGVITETAMAWHLEAVGSGGVRGTGDKKTMQLAAQLYDKVVTNFKQDQFSRFEFPRIIKEDWPNIFKIKYAMADLLYFQKDWEKCGPAFDSVVAEDPNGSQAAEAAYASVLCYQNIYTEKHKDGSDRKGTGNLPTSASAKTDKKAVDKTKFIPKEFTDSQKGMLTAFNRYICYIKPPETDKEAQEQYVEVKFARGRTYFESQHWEEAALAFRDVAINHSDKDVGIFAAQLYLESVNILGANMDPPRPSCYEDMAQDVPVFIDKYCTGGKEKNNSEQCGILLRIQRDIERLRAEKLVEKADKTGGPEALRDYEKAATAYMDLWKKYSEKACEAKEPACERAEEVLYNAARSFQAARLIMKSIAARRILIDPKYNLHNTELAKKSIYEIGGNYQAIAVYDEAANWYERFARENPKMEKAAEALQDSVVLRLGLGQEDQAIKDADLFNKNYGSAKPAQAAQIAFAIGAHYLDKEDWDNARKRLQSAMAQIDRNATFDVQVQAHAMLGRVYVQIKNPSQAVNEYNKVRGYWKNPDDGRKRLDAIGGDEMERDRRLGKVLLAVGEAYFFFAEQKRKDVEKLRFPEYKGSGTREDVLKHVQTKVLDWVKKKRSAIEETEKEYLKVVNLQPSPPPRWVIASGSRVGQMWSKFVAEFRAAPIPKEWKQSGPIPGLADLTWDDLRLTYYNSLDEASEPQKQQAKAAYKTCLNYSVKWQYFDEYSRACEVWLSKSYPAEFHLVDEFRGSPSRMSSGLSERSAPLNLDGSPFRDVGATAATDAPKGGSQPADQAAEKK